MYENTCPKLMIGITNSLEKCMIISWLSVTHVLSHLLYFSKSHVF